MNEDLEEFAAQVAATDYEQPLRTNSIDEVAQDSPPTDKRLMNAKMWAKSGRDYYPSESAVEKLNPGQYSVNFSHQAGFYFVERDINLDSLLVLPDSNSERVLNHIEEFWKSEKVFREYGFLWKRGIMLWGPPGSGKTSTVQQISKMIVDMGGVTIYCKSPAQTSGGLDIFRRIEPERPLVVILEDIDAIIQEYGEADILAMLDGELQVDNVVFIATTNYPGRLDKRFINRPSRFDEIIKIGMPTAAAREYYLAHKNPRLDSEPHEMKEWVDATEGFSVAHLKELIVSVECFGKTRVEAVERLRAMMETTPNDFENTDKQRAGFLV